MAHYHLRTPLKDGDVTQLKIGDLATFSGCVWTCRSRLQKYVFDEGHTLPFSTADRNVLIHVGPVVVRENNAWRLVAFIPTSSIRFEKWGPRSIKTWGLKAIIGKTTMGKATMAAMRAHKCVHLTPIGVTPQIYQDQIKIKDVYWFDELGTIEAAWQLEVDRLGPFLVDIDAEGNNHFEKLDVEINKNRKSAYDRLGIDENFEYTKLY